MRFSLSCVETFLDDCPTVQVQPPETTCDKLDIVFAYGKGSGGVHTGVLNAMQAFADDVFAQYTDVQMGSVTVGALGAVTTETVLTGNVTTFKTAVAGITTAPQGDDRDNNGLLETAIDASMGWRADAAKYIFFIDDFLPGGDNDTYSTTDENELVQAAADGLADGIITNAIRLPVHGLARGATHLAEANRIYAEVAQEGQGFFRQLGLSIDLVAAFKEVLDGLCSEDGGTDGVGYVVSSPLHCCKRAPCRICLEQTCDGVTLYGTATRQANTYIFTGEINGTEVRIFPGIRNGCHMFYEVNSVEELALPLCPDYGETGATCDDPSATIPDVTTGSGYDECEADLIVRRYSPVKLRRTLEDGCAEKYCGGADGPDCTCERLCVEVRDGSGNVSTGTWLDESTECEIGTIDPQWAGPFEGGAGDGDGRIYLNNAQIDYEDTCVVEGNITIDGEQHDLEQVEVTGDVALEATWTLYDGKTVTASCEVCGECQGELICCECRFDNTMEITQTVVSGGDACTIGAGGPITTTYGNGTCDRTDFTDPRWADEDCIHCWTVLYDTSPGPGCSNTDPNRIVVLVQRDATADPHPTIDGTIADNCFWYLLVYDTSYNWISTNYLYGECCHNRLLGPASSHLKWLDFEGVEFGYKNLVYDLLFTNVTTIANHGTTCEEGEA